jgi:alcohol dehydrogenase class IV
VTQVLRGQIQYPYADSFIFGPGCAQDNIQDVLKRLGSQRAFLVTTPSLRQSTLMLRLREALGPYMVGEFTGSRAHTPKDVVLHAARQVREAKVDALISFGGSSAVDLTKAVALVLAEGEELERMRGYFSPAAGLQALELSVPKVPHISLPTTLSGAEFTSIVGIRDSDRGVKNAYSDPKLTPRVVLHDSELCRSTPALLWAGTGMKVFADALEVLCSPRATPYTDALAQGGLTILFQDLPPAVAQADDVTRRGRCLFAVFMVVSSSLHTGLGLVAAFRHQIGAVCGVPHGVASTIMLPHVLRWNLSAACGALSQAARTLAVVDETRDPEAASLRLVETVEDLIARVNLPRRLRDVDVPYEALPRIAEQATHDFSVGGNPRLVQSSAELLEVLRVAW